MKRLLTLALAVLPAAALAHQVGTSYGTFTLDGDRLDVELKLPAAEVRAAFPEAGAARELLGRAVMARVEASRGGAPCPPAQGLVAAEAEGTLRLTAQVACPGAGQVELRLGFLERLLPGHVLLGKISRGGDVEEVVADLKSSSVGVSGREPWHRGAAHLAALGVEHILGGLDHLVFLVALLLAVQGLRGVLAVVTSFTVGHASTLGLAMAGVVAPPAAVVEPLIAASIVATAALNLLDLRRGRDGAGRLWLALGFGLVHGFGFAGALGEVGLPRVDLATALLSFNLGIEAGQAAFVAVVFPLVALLRRRPRLARVGLSFGSVAVGCAGLAWLVERVSGALPG